MRSRYINPAMVNVAEVVAAGLCSQCGACEAGCPHLVISMKRDAHWRFYPEIRDNRPCSTSCRSACVAICPGVHEDPSLWPEPRDPSETYQQWSLGPIDKVWIGHAADDQMKRRGTSGGAVTALLVHLLESGAIDGVLLVGPNRASPYEHDIHIARSREEIEAAWGSKYYPMPIARKFKDLTKEKGKYAVVLLGCHMRALRLMEARSKRLRSSLVLRIGLICGYCSGFKGLLDEAQAQGIEDFSTVTRVDYRAGKWPGKVRIATSGKSVTTSIYRFLERLPFTTNYRCMICSDMLNETADISFGDAWLKDLTDRQDEGWSIFTSRTMEATKMVRRAASAGALVLEESSVERLVKSQEKPLRYKKHGLIARYAFTRFVLRRSLPNHDLNYPREKGHLNPWNIMGNWAFLATVLLFFPRDRLRRMVLNRAPRRLVRWYVRALFLMIAHDGTEAMMPKLLSSDKPALNCDA